MKGAAMPTKFPEMQVARDIRRAPNAHHSAENEVRTMIVPCE
jgi:hypothetical protein